METNQNNEIVYGIVNNIPGTYHSSDLRNFFSQFIETNGFHCFHFRHRPEKQMLPKSADKDMIKNDAKTFCCVFRTTPIRLDNLIKMYNRKHWLDKNGDSISQVCYISKISVSQTTKDFALGLKPGDADPLYKNRAESKQIPTDREDFTDADLSKLPELHPPDVMPNGNVGTPTKVFLELIQQCRLPPVVIKKLGLTFPKTRTNKKYGDVPFDYGREIVETDFSDETVTCISGQGHKLLSEGVFQKDDVNNIAGPSQNTSENGESLKQTELDEKNDKKKKSDRHWRRDPETKKRMKEKIEEKMIAESDHSEGDNDSCEEWERHEAFHDDPDNQERNEERLFENEIELKWEKGGSGLVFYTDAQYWKEQEGDFDEQTTDDWDVDMSAYYEKGAGDKDIKDFLAMRQSQRWRDGIDSTDRFSLGIAKKRQKKNESAADQAKIGKFEVHTKGIGRKILEKQGWQEGKGVGSSREGMAEALENEGQPASVKTGFGYHGEKISRQSSKPRTADRQAIISTVYDSQQELQKSEPLLRRHDHYTITYRDPVHFKKAESEKS
ncbi:G patch domain-containing protein 3-like [Mytilus trossulus]|uniref:G patch domain-containing protein 3-like n=1 Tax=Mytilus trossulus TaxID=6551 RepID=UPI0030063DB6